MLRGIGLLLCLWNRKAKALQPLNQNGRIPDSQTPPGPTYLPSKHTCHAMISEKRPLVACECRTHNPQLFPLASSSEPKSCPFSRTKTLDPKPKDHTPHNFRTNTCVGVPWIVVAVAVLWEGSYRGSAQGAPSKTCGKGLFQDLVECCIRFVSP